MTKAGVSLFKLFLRFSVPFHLYSSTMRLSALLFIPAVLSVSPEPRYYSHKVVPAMVSTLPTTALFTSSSFGFDGPKAHPINLTTYDWWYFDAVSADAMQSIVVVFFTVSPPFTFPQAPAISLPSLLLSI